MDVRGLDSYSRDPSHGYYSICYMQSEWEASGGIETRPVPWVSVVGPPQKLDGAPWAHPRGATRQPHGYGTYSPCDLAIELQVEHEMSVRADKRRFAEAGSPRYCPQSFTSSSRAAEDIHWRPSSTQSSMGVCNGVSDMDGAVDGERDSWGSDSDSVSSSFGEGWCRNLGLGLISGVTSGVSGEGSWGESRGGRGHVIIDGENPPWVGAT